MSFFSEYWKWAVTALALLLAIPAALHVIVEKRESTAATGWLGLILLQPLLGPILYFLFGVNRIARKARRYQITYRFALKDDKMDSSQFLSADDEQMTISPVTGITSLRCLRNGRSAYDAMLEAIAGASVSIEMTSYIFDNDASGREFVQALASAKRRGVRVRVLIDDVGGGFYLQGIDRHLRREGVPYSRFMPLGILKRVRTANLRNHRKLLVVDKKVAFTGGMNISDDYVHNLSDLHFELQGPVVDMLQQVFYDDWRFNTGESLKPLAVERPKATVVCVGQVVPDAPGIESETIHWRFQSLIQTARESVCILSPYFIPPIDMMRSLIVAKLRGVRVEIVTPKYSDVTLATWASIGAIRELLIKGCAVYQSPAPFDHSKLMVVDSRLVVFGSANWDSRSLFLNFELNVEVESESFAGEMMQVFEEKKEKSKRFTLQHWQKRSYPVKVRDGLARLLGPYL